MTGEQLAQKCLEIVNNYKTCYAKGTFGQNATDAFIDSKTKQYPQWYTKDRVKMLKGLPDDTKLFDCVGVPKAILWGFPNTVYTSNGVPDLNDSSMWNVCTDKTQSFSNIEVGELTHMQGHVGIYIGNGKCVECTPSWRNGVQITAVQNMGAIAGLPSRKWEGHGKLPYVSYKGGGTYKPSHPTLRRGDTGSSVKELQELLVAKGYDPKGVDGCFGPGCEAAVKKFQKDNGLEVDGIVGPKTWDKLLKAETPQVEAPKTETFKRPMVHKGDSGNVVKELQELLVMNGYNPYGDFGSACEKAVMQFQKDHNLAVDGCVGPKTWEALIK